MRMGKMTEYDNEKEGGVVDGVNRQHNNGGGEM